MKRLFLVFCIVLLATSVILANEPLVVVTIDSHVPVYEYAAAVFEELHGVPVQIVSQAYDKTHEVIVTAAVGKSSGFDVVAIDTIYVSNYALAGIVEPLTNFAPTEYFDQHIESSLDMLSYDGVPYALGGGYNYKYFYYNEALLKQGGFDAPPATWDEFVEISKSLQEQGLVRFGTAWGWAQAEGLVCDYTIILNSFGGEYFDQNDQLLLNTQPAKQALQFMYDSIHTDKIADPASTSLTDREVMSLFLNEDIAFVLNWDFGWTWSQDPSQSKVIDSTRIGLVPGSEHKASSTTGGGSGPAILTSSNKKDLAWKFIETFNLPEVQLAFLTDLKSLRVTLKGLLEDDALQQSPYPDMFAQQIYAYPRAKLAWYPQFSSMLQSELHQALTQSKNVEQALKDVENQTERLLRQFGDL